MYSNRHLNFALVSLFLGGGCASLDPQAELSHSAQEIEQATGTSGEAVLIDSEAASLRTSELLTDGLTADEAIQVALLNNPRVRAAMLSIGVSRADFVQSTLFTNPTLALSLRLPDGGGLANFGAEFAQNIAELWLMPARKRVAEHNLERTVLEAARTAASIALDARMAYIRAVRAEEQQTIARDTLEITQRLVETALLRQQAGSGSEIDVNLARTQKLDATTAARNAELAVTEARSELARLLGLAEPPDSFPLLDRLPDPAIWPQAPAELQRIAREHRLDLRMADQSVSIAEARAREERVRFLKSVEVGFALERGRRARGDRNWAAETFYDSLQGGQFTPPNLMPREPEGTNEILGPTLGMELPLWDQNQAQVAKADHLLQQAVQLRDALMIDAAQDIHLRLARARTATQNAGFYRDEQLPAAQRNASLSRDAYRAGRLSLLSVLEAERSYLAARSGYLAALENAALAAVELERVTGRSAAELHHLEPAPPPATRPADQASTLEVQ